MFFQKLFQKQWSAASRQANQGHEAGVQPRLYDDYRFFLPLASIFFFAGANGRQTFSTWTATPSNSYRPPDMPDIRLQLRQTGNTK
jgi:hypothetical protein